MIKTWIYLLLMISIFSGGPIQNTGSAVLSYDEDYEDMEYYEDSEGTNQSTNVSDSIEEYYYYEEIDLEYLADLFGGIMDLFAARNIKLDSKDRVCLFRNTTLEEFKFEYCFHDLEISNITEALHELYVEAEEDENGFAV